MEETRSVSEIRGLVDVTRVVAWSRRLSARGPLQKVLEQLIAFGLGQRPAARLGRLSGLLLSSLLLLPLARQHLRAEIRERCLGAVEPFPAPYRGEEIGLAPFRIARRLLKFGEFRKERFHEPVDALVAICALRPVVGDQHARG